MEAKLLCKYTLDELIIRAKSEPKPYTKIVDGIIIFENRETKLMLGEEFKKHPDEPVFVSNIGRVKSINEEKVLPQFPDTDENKYDYLYVRIKGKREYNKLVYQLVAETWLDNPNRKLYCIVHHITNNGYDNRVSNLMWVTKEQHSKIHEWGK